MSNAGTWPGCPWGARRGRARCGGRTPVVAGRYGPGGTLHGQPRGGTRGAGWERRWSRPSPPRWSGSEPPRLDGIARSAILLGAGLAEHQSLVVETDEAVRREMGARDLAVWWAEVKAVPAREVTALEAAAKRLAPASGSAPVAVRRPSTNTNGG